MRHTTTVVAMVAALLLGWPLAGCDAPPEEDDDATIAEKKPVPQDVEEPSIEPEPDSPMVPEDEGETPDESPRTDDGGEDEDNPPTTEPADPETEDLGEPISELHG